MDDTPNYSENFVIAIHRWHRVKNDACPVCGGELDTGWECNVCGRDWREMALSPEPKPEDYPDEEQPGSSPSVRDNRTFWTGIFVGVAIGVLVVAPLLNLLVKIIT